MARLCQLAVAVLSLTACSRKDQPTGTTTASPPSASTSTTAVTATPAPPSTPTKPEDFTTLPAEFKYSQENVDGYCREEWTKRGELDQKMFRYCASQEKKGYDELGPIAKKWASYQWFPRIFRGSWNEWTKRGLTRYSMVAHTMKSETDAALDIEYEEKQPSYKKDVMERCFDEWNRHPHAFTMMRHCYKNSQ